MGNVSGKICIENQNKRYMFNFVFQKNHAVNEKMWKIWYS